MILFSPFMANVFPSNDSCTVTWLASLDGLPPPPPPFLPSSSAEKIGFTHSSSILSLSASVNSPNRVATSFGTITCASWPSTGEMIGVAETKTLCFARTVDNFSFTGEETS